MSACLTTWARTTTCHGVKELLDSKKIQVKIFWLAVLLAAFGGICYYEKILVTTFLSVPTVTRISHVDVNQLEFPIVTLCNDNVYSLMKFLKKWEEVKQIFTAIRNGYGNEIAFLAYFSWAPLYYRNKMFNRSGYTIVEVEEFEILFNKSVDINPFSKIDLMEFLKTTSYDCYDIFKQLGDCKFGLTTFDCCANANLVQSNIGNCYEINPESLDRSISLKASQLFPGLNQGLHLVVTYNMSDSIPLSPLQSQTIGYYISIGGYMTLFDFSVITIGPGEFASVQLTQKVYQFDPTVTFCVSERFQLAYVPPEKSNQFLCMQECQVNATIQFCGCAVVFPNSNLPENVRCDPLVSRQCFGLSRIIYNLTYRKFITNCQAVNCPTECESRLYKASVVYSRAKQPNRTNDPDLITSAINIYFSELQYTLEVEKPLLDVISVVSNFGGNMSLMAGISLITVAQLFSYLIKWCAEIFINIKSKNI